MRRAAIALFLGLTAVLVIMSASTFEPATDFQVARYYIKNAYTATGAPNSVASIYLFYRYYDTLFEALMLLFSIIGVIYMSVHGEGDAYDQ